MPRTIKATVHAEDLHGRDRDSAISLPSDPLPFPTDTEPTFEGYADQSSELREEAQFVTRAEFEGLLDAIRDHNRRSPQKIHI